jgi:hypothetical protein
MTGKDMNNKRGQVAIFVIIAILIVAVALIFFLWVQPTYIAPSGGQFGFESCMEEVIEDSMEVLGIQAGFRNPEFSYTYRGEDIGYLCYTHLYHKQCSVQKPFLKQHFEDELMASTRGQIEACYDGAVNGLKAQGYEVSSGQVDLDIELVPGKITVNIDAPTTVARASTQRFVNFKFDIQNRIYDMLMISTSILQSETKYGDSDTSTLMRFYPEFIVDKLKQSDGTTIYILTDKEVGTTFQFASRSMAWPAGYGLDGK